MRPLSASLLYCCLSNALTLSSPFAAPSVLAMTVAAEVAAERPDVRGPNTFRSALIDELYNLTADEVVKRANIEVVV